MRFLLEDINNTLNPKIWDEDKKLKQEVANKLDEITNRFVSGIEEKGLDLNILDRRIVGSNASYNYTKYSDLDIHIIVDLDNFSNKNLIKLLLDFYKSAFNKKYNIKIKGINVELYFEEKGNNLISNGVYSLDSKEWLKEPVQQEIVEVDISDTLQYMIEKYEQVLLLNNKEEAQKLLDYLHENRQRSLALEGEFGVDNLVFKEFRNRGYIDKLKEIIVNGESFELSLESLKEKFAI